LLACSLGVAIVEDKSRGELNPNVAMEWGFLRAFGRPVLYLEERSFKKQRADWHGLIKHSFTWDEPEDDIHNGVTEWLSSSRGGRKG
jgi:nucleoside 2-deoxyribosyltransferase